jgi:hypothetical protein
LQYRPSLQAAWFAVRVQLPLGSLQASVVHEIPSAQSTGVPATQPVTALQVSAPLQTRPSLQTAWLAVWVQLSVASLQASVVHETPSLQSTGAPATQPVATLQVSMPLQN